MPPPIPAMADGMGDIEGPIEPMLLPYPPGAIPEPIPEKKRKQTTCYYCRCFVIIVGVLLLLQVLCYYCLCFVIIAGVLLLSPVFCY